MECQYSYMLHKGNIFLAYLSFIVNSLFAGGGTYINNNTPTSIFVHYIVVRINNMSNSLLSCFLFLFLYNIPKGCSYQPGNRFDNIMSLK